MRFCLKPGEICILISWLLAPTINSNVLDFKVVVAARRSNSFSVFNLFYEEALSEFLLFVFIFTECLAFHLFLLSFWHSIYFN